jgi:hypothetical protein
VTGRPELWVGLRKLRWNYQEASSNRCCGKYRQGWKGCWARALRIGTGRIEMARMMPWVLMAAMLVRGTRCIRVAQHDSESPVHWREHEASGDEGAKAQHRQHERRGPVASTSAPQPAVCALHRCTKMPHRMAGIK